MVAQRSGWLVHDDDLRAIRNRPSYLDHLFVANTESADTRGRIQLHFEFRQNLQSLRVHLSEVDQTGGRKRFPSEKDVLGDTEVIDDRQFLIDDADAEGSGMDRVPNDSFLAFNSDDSLVTPVNSR